MKTARMLGSMTVPGLPESVAETRDFASWLLPEGETAETVVLLISEAVTNSVVHSRSGAGGLVTLTLSEADADVVRVEVIDDGAPTLPTLRSSTETSTGGRGIELIAGLADRSGWHVGCSGGLLLWFEVSGLGLSS